VTGYFRPLVQTGLARPADAVPLAGGPGWFTQAQELTRDGGGAFVSASEIPADILDWLSRPRAPIAGLDMSQPHLMGILNVTPDSFSDGGQHDTLEAACARAQQMIADGAALIDIGGESTRPGAEFVPEDEEIRRTGPVIRAVLAEREIPISIDTRKSAVARAALQAGAGLVNDVSGFTFDADLAPLCAEAGVPVCVMHAQGDPATMQQRPFYENVVLDVYDFLSDQVNTLVSKGISRDAIVIDPGIGFGKTLDHNLAILQNLSVFHGIGCAILLGASRKRFIGTIGEVAEAQDRAPGSIAVGLAGIAQGVQILRVHDVGETAQALRLWRAVG